MIAGRVFLLKKDYPFTFENGILNISIEIDNKTIKPLSSGKINEKIINGVFNNDSQFITFYVGDYNYQTGFNIKYIAQTTIKIPVKFYLTHSAPLENLKFNKIKIRFENSKFRKFFDFYEKHSLPIKLTKRDVLNFKSSFNTSALKKIVLFTFDKIKCTLFPHFSLTHSKSDIVARVGLNLELKTKTINFDLLDRLFDALYKTLKFIYYRQNIELNSAMLMLSMKINDKFLFDKIGEFHLLQFNRHEMENSDLNSINDYGFIPWKIVYKYLPNLIKLITDENIYLHNLPISKEEKGFTSINSVSLDASAFEFEYIKLYGKTQLFADIDIRTKEVDKIKDFILESVDSTYIETSVNCINNVLNPALKMKNIKALSDFEFVIKPTTDKFGYKDYVNDISKEFIKKRNEIDHGLKNTKITVETANAYYIERMLIYSMQLKRIGMSEKDIIDSIKYVFELF